MTTETLSEDDSSYQKPGSLAQLAERMDSESRLLAEKLHKLGYIYVLYGALDGLSLSYSMIKYVFDLFLANSDLSPADEMHDWMISPEGAAIAATSSITLIVFSMLANHFDDDDKNRFKRYIAVVWPYFRDIIKALKNAYKGVKSTFQVAQLLSGLELNHLVVPVGLLLGGLSVINRIWFRAMVNKRKDMMKTNAKLLVNIQNLQAGPELSVDDALAQLDEFHSQIIKQSNNVKTLALLSAAYSGVVDGLYLYIGVLGLCSLAPPALIAMTVFCTIYFLACIATRVYEEYDFQRRLIIAQTKAELAYEGKRIELLFAKLQNLTQQVSEAPQNEVLLAEQEEAILLFEIAIGEFKEKQQKLRSLSTLSYTSAFLAGAKNGLAAYGALTSMIFAISTILVLTSTAFPPALLITAISIGLILLMGFIAHSIIHTYRHRARMEQQALEQKDIILDTGIELADLGDLFKEARQEVNELRPEEIKTAIRGGMVIDPSPQFFFQEWFEVIRSLFSGFGKGSKAIDLTMNPLEESGVDGHYHQTAIMAGFIGLSIVAHVLVLTARALSRGFGRPPIDAVPAKKDNPDIDVELEIEPASEEGDLPPEDNEAPPVNRLLQQSNSSFGTRHSFFSKVPQPQEPVVTVRPKPSASSRLPFYCGQEQEKECPQFKELSSSPVVSVYS